VGTAVRMVADQDRTSGFERRTPGYFLVDMSGSLTLTPPWPAGSSVRLSVAVKNLLDRTYRDHLSAVTWWDGPGRNIVIGIRTEW